LRLVNINREGYPSIIYEITWETNRLARECPPAKSVFIISGISGAALFAVSQPGA
jgi:hypothetical protein